MKNTVCDIYRCSKKEGMYLYLPKGVDCQQLPDALLKAVGKMELAMTVLLTHDKKLARAKASDVLAAINHQGFYLQMPPGELPKDLAVLH